MPLHQSAQGGTRIVGAQRAAAPVLSGSVPPLAASFHPRPETGLALADALRPGHTIVLVPGQGGDPSGSGGSDGGMSAAGAVSGTGKTQLAVELRTPCGTRAPLTCWSGFRPETGPRSWPVT